MRQPPGYGARMTAVDDSQAATAAGASVQSVDRALTILEMLAREGEAGVTEIAAELGVHKSTAFRLLATLESHRLVEQDGDRGRYRLGVGNLRLAGATTARLDLVTEARPVCRQLAADTGETVNITVRSETSALYLDQVAGSSGAAEPQLGRAAHPAARDQQRQGAAERAGRDRPQGGAAGAAAVHRHDRDQPAGAQGRAGARSARPGTPSRSTSSRSGSPRRPRPIRSAHGDVIASMSISGPDVPAHRGAARRDDPAAGRGRHRGLAPARLGAAHLTRRVSAHGTDGSRPRSDR